MKKKIYILILWSCLLSSSFLFGKGVSRSKSSKPLKLHHQERELFLERSHLTGDWYGIRRKLQQEGFFVDSFFTLDMNWPTIGGYKTSSKPLFQYLYELNLEWRSEPLLKYKGGTFYLSFQYHGGAHPTQDYVHDFMGVDSISSPNLTQLGEVWYQQNIKEDLFYIKFGKIDAIENFQFTDNALYLVNSGYETFPTILGFPTYPNPAMGVLFYIKPSNYIQWGAGIFDGSGALGTQTGGMGPSRFFNNLGDHAFIISELDWMWPTLYDGKLKLGGWGNTVTLQRFNGQNQNGVGGGYVIFEQTLYPGEGKKKQWKTGMFLQYAFTNPEVSKSDYFIAGGTQIHNVLDRGTLEDFLCFGIACSHFTNAKGSNFRYPFEMSIEATYWLQIFGWFQMQPDLQYVVHPGGKYKDSLVITLRFNVDI